MPNTPKGNQVNNLGQGAGGGRAGATWPSGATPEQKAASRRSQFRTVAGEEARRRSYENDLNPFLRKERRKELARKKKRETTHTTPVRTRGAPSRASMFHGKNSSSSKKK
jgi:hypothetical protein